MNLARLHVLVLLLAFGFAARGLGQRHTRRQETAAQWPTIVDTFHVPLGLRTATGVEEGMFTPLYIGKPKASIYNSRSGDYTSHRTPESYPPPHPYPSEQTIHFEVDTSKVILYPALLDTLAKRVTRDLQSYPVYLRNVGNDTLLVGYGSHFGFYLEARDSLGEWRTIQRPYVYGSATGLVGIYLAPGEIAVTKVPIFAGNFRTRLRLRYHNLLSEEYDGWIDPRQFSKLDGDQTTW